MKLTLHDPTCKNNRLTTDPLELYHHIKYLKYDLLSIIYSSNLLLCDCHIFKHFVRYVDVADVDVG